jgi:hypothetical protein
MGKIKWRERRGAQGSIEKQPLRYFLGGCTMVTEEEPENLRGRGLCTEVHWRCSKEEGWRRGRQERLRRPKDANLTTVKSTNVPLLPLTL